MTSKEALEKLINKTGIINDTCAHLLACVKCGKCKFEDPIETCDDYQLVMTIEKDLEVLDVLKKYLYYDNKNHFIKMKQIRKSTFNFDYEDLKEWLENE